MRVIAGPEKKSRLLLRRRSGWSRPTTRWATRSSGTSSRRGPGAQDLGRRRGQALGYTISMPVEDKFLTTRAQLEDQMAMTLGGRAAEELVFDEITTGAANDLEKVTRRPSR